MRKKKWVLADCAANSSHAPGLCLQHKKMLRQKLPLITHDLQQPKSQTLRPKPSSILASIIDEETSPAYKGQRARVLHVRILCKGNLRFEVSGFCYTGFRASGSQPRAVKFEANGSCLTRRGGTGNLGWNKSAFASQVFRYPPNSKTCDVWLVAYGIGRQKAGMLLLARNLWVGCRIPGLGSCFGGMSYRKWGCGLKESQGFVGRLGKSLRSVSGFRGRGKQVVSILVRNSWGALLDSLILIRSSIA